MDLVPTGSTTEAWIVIRTPSFFSGTALWQLLISTAAQAVIKTLVRMRFILQLFNRLKIQIPAVFHIRDLSTGTDNAFQHDLNDHCHG